MTIARYLLATLIAVVVVLAVLTFTPLATHPADACYEDENWVTTDYRDPEGQEWHNVTRKCANIDDEPWTLIDNG